MLYSLQVQRQIFAYLPIQKSGSWEREVIHLKLAMFLKDMNFPSLPPHESFDYLSFYKDYTLTKKNTINIQLALFRIADVITSPFGEYFPDLVSILRYALKRMKNLDYLLLPDWGKAETKIYGLISHLLRKPMKTERKIIKIILEYLPPQYLSQDRDLLLNKILDNLYEYYYREGSPNELAMRGQIDLLEDLINRGLGYKEYLENSDILGRPAYFLSKTRVALKGLDFGPRRVVREFLEDLLREFEETCDEKGIWDM